MSLEELNQPCILLVDDDVTVIQVLSKCLAGLGRLRFATSGEVALRLAREETPDLMLLDAEMPGMNGFELLETMRREPVLGEVPVIFVTSHSEQSMEEKGLDLGAADFIAKPIRPSIVAARVKTQLRLKLALDRLKKMATTDGLTQCANRRFLDETLTEEWSRTVRARLPFSILMLDVDHFKKFNDLYGHLQGDQALIRVSGALRRSACRPGDLVGRYGGEEFVVLLPDTDQAGACKVGDALHAEVEKLGIAHSGSERGHLSVSIGIASFDADSSGWASTFTSPYTPAALPAGMTVEGLLAIADGALYSAKQAGRACSAFAQINLHIPQA